MSCFIQSIRTLRKMQVQETLTVNDECRFPGNFDGDGSAPMLEMRTSGRKSDMAVRLLLARLLRRGWSEEDLHLSNVDHLGFVERSWIQSVEVVVAECGVGGVDDQLHALNPVL